MKKMCIYKKYTFTPQITMYKVKSTFHKSYTFIVRSVNQYIIDVSKVNSNIPKTYGEPF